MLMLAYHANASLPNAESSDDMLMARVGLALYTVRSIKALSHCGQEKMATFLADNIFIWISLNENFWVKYH